MTGTTDQEARRRSGVGLRSERGPVLAALMLCMALVAIDGTVIATAVPSIVAQLGGFSQFPWLFSAYLLTQAVTTPLYGRFADVLGRRPVLLVGIGLFLAGSVLCGVAWSMPVLIAARAVQGLGAGAVQPIALTIVGDLYSVQERSRVQGYMASVWGASAVIGPLIGGVFSEYLSWRWVFFVNLPVGGFAVVMLLRHFQERITRTAHRIDYLGSALLVGACGLLILGLLEGGVAWAWRSGSSVAVLGLGVLLLLGFLAVENRSAEPVLPLWVLRRRVLVGANLSQLAVGALLVGLSSYVPTYVQGVLGTGPLVAGFTVAALTMGWPISASQAGRVYLRIGFRDTAVLGAAVVIVGSAACMLWGDRTPVLEVAAVCFVIGLGMGFASAPVVVAIQSVVGWEQRGVVTSASMFARTLGSALGVAGFGAVANATLSSRLAAAPPALSGRVPTTLDAATQALAHSAQPDVVRYVREALNAATHHVFLGFAAVAVVMLVGMLLMPRLTRTLDGAQVIDTA